MPLSSSLRLITPLLWGLLGFTVGVMAILYVWVQARPATGFWHEPALHHQRLAELEDLRSASWADYVTHEQTQFAGLQRLIDRKAHKAEQPLPPWHRFSPTGKANSLAYEPNWNQSFYLAPKVTPRFAVVLVHGLSDSPYSMRALGLAYAEAGAQVYGLRVPGHGLTPGMLLNYRWETAAQAVALAVREAAANHLPVYLVGYSNGAALSLHYALSQDNDNHSQALAGLVLLAPALQVSPLANFAYVQAWLGHLPGYYNLAWVDIYPEYDPYKYNSFPVQAGKEMYELTESLLQKTSDLSDGDKQSFPPVLAFMSATDATVSASAVKSRLLDTLNNPKHELVLFDVNHQAEAAGLLRNAHRPFVTQLRDQAHTFNMRLISNQPISGTSVERQVVEFYRPAHHASSSATSLPYEWPADVYSLSHVAMPFAPDDPINGNTPADENTAQAVYLGGGGVRGERGAFIVSMDQLARLRFNPFFDYVVERSVQFMTSNPEPAE